MVSDFDSKVAKGVGYRNDGFDFVDVLGSAINNEQFAEGWRNYKAGRDSEDAYVWAALSACGEEIADAVYQNVRNYVDLASNIETCKVKVLASMIGELGLGFLAGDDFDRMPYQILHMMDAYSVDRKYLFASGVLSPDVVSAILSGSSAERVTSAFSRQDWELGAWEAISLELSGRGIAEDGWE